MGFNTGNYDGGDGGAHRIYLGSYFLLQKTEAQIVYISLGQVATTDDDNDDGGGGDDDGIDGS